MSLMELLVAFTVLLILAALITSGVGELRKRAHTAQCAGNLRQIGSLVALYSGENQNSLPPWQTVSASGGVISDQQLWFHHLLPYIRDGNWRVSGTLWSGTSNLAGQGVDVFKCPAQKDPFILNYRIRYGINPTHTSYTNHANPDASRDLKTTHLRNPSRAILIADSMDAESDGAPFSATPGAARGFIVLSSLAEPVSDRHMGGANILFVDGHVEHRPFEDVTILPGDPPDVRARKMQYWNQREQ